jgi:CheY-like chemotaxis protein
MDSHRSAVLVIDSDPVGRDAAVRLLDREGFAVAVAANAEQAFTYARDHHPGAILLAMTLPGIAGIESLERLKADSRTREIPVVVHDRRELTAPARPTHSLRLIELLRRHVAPQRITGAAY